MKYKVHRVNIKKTNDQSKLEKFLNGLHGEVIAIVPNVAVTPITRDARIDFLLIVEKVG